MIYGIFLYEKIYDNLHNMQFLSERLLTLTLDERRENYFCGSKAYKPLSEIPTWQEQFNDNRKSLSEKGLKNLIFSGSKPLCLCKCLYVLVKSC